jgi:hypothetical protein
MLEVMIDRANDVYNRWLNDQEAPIINHVEEHDAAGKLGQLSRSVHTNGQVTHFNQPGGICQASSSQGRTLPVPDPFARAHRSLAQCIHDVHERAKAAFPNPSRNHCRCHSSTAAGNRNAVWPSCTPPPRVESPVSPVVMRQLDLSKEISSPSGYGRLQTMNPSNETIPSLHAYFHLTTDPRSVYEMYGDNAYAYSSLLQDGLGPSLPDFLTSSSILADPIRANDDQNWMAFF